MIISSGFFRSVQGKNGANAWRICEYFNEAMAEKSDEITRLDINAFAYNIR